MRVFRYVSEIGATTFAEDNGKTVSDVQVAKTGTWEHFWYGEFSITRTNLKEFVKNFKGGKRDVVVDYQHSSLSSDPNQAIAAGWVKSLSIRDKDELWAAVEWTEKAVEHIRAGEYKYISPEFELNCKDKETGESLGAVLLAIALTNRPFLEGMAPVMLSEGILLPPIYLAEWTRAYINDLPDAAFAHIESGGEKDEDGKTTPRSLRHFPHHTMACKGPMDHDSVDMPHLRNALARIPQSDLSQAAKDAATKHLRKHAEALGVGEAGKEKKTTQPTNGGERKMDEKRIREILQLAEDVEVTDEHRNLALKKLDEELATAKTQVTTLTEQQTGTVRLTETQYSALQVQAQAGADAAKKLREMETDAILSAAVSAGRVLPVEVEGLKKLMEKDFDGVKALIGARPKLVGFGEIGGNGRGGGPAGDGEKVKTFIDEKIKAGVSLKEAQRWALKEIGAEAFDEYRRMA